MIKSIIQYLKDVRHTIDLSDKDDFIFIYLPLLGMLGGVAMVLILVINSLVS